MKCALSLAASAIGVAEAWHWHDTLPGEPREPERFGPAGVCRPCRSGCTGQQRVAIVEPRSSNAAGDCLGSLGRQHSANMSEGARVVYMHALATALTCLSNRRWSSMTTPSDFMCVETCSEQPATSTAVGMAADRNC